MDTFHKQSELGPEDARAKKAQEPGDVAAHAASRSPTGKLPIRAVLRSHYKRPFVAAPQRQDSCVYAVYRMSGAPQVY